MKLVGEFATFTAAVVVVLGVVIGIKSIPDIQRYLKIRQM